MTKHLKTDDTEDPAIWRLADLLDGSTPIIGPLLGDVVWYFNSWKFGQKAFVGMEVSSVLLMTEIADMLTEGTTTR